jgi:hypothetical protein
VFINDATKACGIMGVLDQSIQALKVLSPVLDMVPAIGGNLKGAAELASEICEMVKVRAISGALVKLSK